MIEDTGPDILCPACGSRLVRVAHRRKLLDWALAPVLHAPMRCRDCRHRFYYSQAFGRSLGVRGGAQAVTPFSPTRRAFEKWRRKRGGQFVRITVVLSFVAVIVYAFFKFISQAPAI